MRGMTLPRETVPHGARGSRRMYTVKEDPLLKGKRYTEEQIAHMLGEVESGGSVAQASRQYGVLEGTIHR